MCAGVPIDVTYRLRTRARELQQGLTHTSQQHQENKYCLCCPLYLQDHIQASKELQTSPTFKLLLSVTLGLGNFVNHGSRLAPAGGFRLKTLNKLHDSKTPDAKQTMLQVGVVGVCIQTSSTSSSSSNSSSRMGLTGASGACV
jgi:hypothetical protein